MKPVRLSSHARERIAQRGATEKEVVEAIRSSHWQDAERGRHECQRDFPFHRDWNGKFYATKRVRPVFVDKEREILVVTVYVYYA